eukprot:TRINITY_DN10732_c0_g1_i1.p1 TRINITY_DN10732_c0_g1~~TRINITY_DN10732_c0_g1_i1.p1  ORF type:complete len:513 (+),score=201.45 TRINITY_DN10732_c0_g1_i1:300-1838(+)
MSVKVLPTCESASGSFRSSKRPFGMLSSSPGSNTNNNNNNSNSTNSGNPSGGNGASSVSRARQGLKLSFHRSISDPQPPPLAMPNKRFCPPPLSEEEEKGPLEPARADLLSLPTLPGNYSNSNHRLPSRSLPVSPSNMDSPLTRSLLLSKVKSISARELAARLAGNDSPLLLDCRSFIAYNVNHVRNAFNVNVCDRFNRKRLQQGKASLGDLAASKVGKEALKGTAWREIVVYDDASENLETLPCGHTLLIVLNALVEDGREPLVLLGGFRAFELVNRGFCENHLMEEDDLDSPCCRDLPSPAKDIENFPASQVLPHMYLGNMRDAGDLHVLQSLGVGYVLNVTSKPPGYTLDPSIHYKQLHAADNGFQNLHQFFEEAFEFIDLAKRNSSGVLIHCQAGVSRSPTIAVAYLMKYYSMAMAEAYKFVKNRRSIISPNLNFMGQLWEFEQGLLSNHNNNNRLSPQQPLRRTSSFSDSLSSSEDNNNDKNNQDFNSNIVSLNDNILLSPATIFRQ